jgi:hypothetical protein
VGKSNKTQLRFDGQELAEKLGLEGIVMEFEALFDPNEGNWVFNVDTYVRTQEDDFLQTTDNKNKNIETESEGILRMSREGRDRFWMMGM